MKKVLILSLVTVLSSNISFGQFNTREWNLSQGVSFHQIKTTPPDTGGEATQTISTLELLPSVGYFVYTNSLIGLGIGYYQNKNAYEGFYDIETKTNGIIINPYLRYYFPTKTEGFTFYMQGNFNHRSGTRKTSMNGDPGAETKSLDWSVVLSPGLNYFISKRVALEIGFAGVSYTKTDPNKTISNDELKKLDVGLNSILPSYIGVQFFFR